MKPVKKKASSDWNPLKRAVRTLIKNLDIRDENGNLAQFSLKLIRPTRLTQLFEQGHDLALVSAWAGHKRLATTSTFYTYVSCQQIEAETCHIQKALFNTEGGAIHYESFINKKRQAKLSSSDTIELKLDKLGISLNPTLTKTIKSANEEAVLAAIEAFKDQLTKQGIPNPGGWLNKVISEGWTKAKPISNKPSTTASQSKIIIATDKPNKKLMSADKLKKLSNLFNNKDD